MSSRVMPLARAHVLGQKNARLSVAMVFVVALINGGIFLRMDVWEPHKLGGLTGLYVMLALVACAATSFIDVLHRRPRLGDFERSLPVGDRDWWRAGLLSRIRLAVLMLLAAAIAHFLVATLSVLPMTSLAVPATTLGCALLAITAGYAILGRHPSPSGWRVAFSFLPAVVAVAVLKILPTAGVVLACAAPVAVVAAWWLAPVRFASISASRSVGTAADVAGGERATSVRSVTQPDAVAQMWRKLAWCNWAWWVESVMTAAMWVAFFVPLFGRQFPFFTIGIGWCVLTILAMRPSYTDQKVLQPVRHLPFPRRKLFAIIGGKAILAPAVGILLVAIGASWSLSRDRATLLRRHSIQATGLEQRERRGVDVILPGEHWRLVFRDAPILVHPDDGEPIMVQPRLAFPGIYVWHPYQLPENCSVATASRQFSRALHDIHGVDKDPQAIAELLVALPDGTGVELAPHTASPSSDGVGTRNGVLERIADAPLLFLPMLGLVAWSAWRRFAVRQLPARPLVGVGLLALAAIAGLVAYGLHQLLILGPQGDFVILIRAVLASVRDALFVPGWLLFAICPLAVWPLWSACARRFDRMEAPPAIPGLPEK